jgi:hypothetical protein
MRPRLLSAIAAGLLLAAAPGGLEAQQLIHGKLLTDRTNVPVAGATVQLLRATGAELNRIVQTNKHGSFIMQVEPGRYRLSVRRISYSPVQSDIITVEPGKNVTMNLVLTPISVRLATQTVTALTRLETGRPAMAKREALDQGGYFLYRKDFAEIANKTVPEILEKVPGLRARPDGSIETLEGNRCLQFLINRLPITEIPIQYLMPGQSFASLYEMLPDGLDIMGVEVYRRFSEVPKELRQDAWPYLDDRGVTIPRVLGSARKQTTIPACGLINFWTSAAW